MILSASAGDAQPPLSTVERQVTSSIRLTLKGDKRALSQSLFAINWFNTRVAWIYHLYNLLASSRLTKMGGQAFFKGRVTEMLMGDESLGREHLLIVNYPSAASFLDLVADKVFQVFSLLRMATVRQFSFVMHKRLSHFETGDTAARHASHAILHFRSELPIDEIMMKLKQTADTTDVQVVFASQQVVALWTQRKSEEPQLTPFVTENVVVLGAFDDGQIRTLVGGKHFERFTSSMPSFYVALLRRTV